MATTDIKDTAHPVDAPSVMRLLKRRPRLLALGEPTHGEDPLLHLRNDLFRGLVEEGGYRTIALETDCLAAQLVDDHVTRGTGTLDDVMEHGFTHGFGASAANRDLVRWMRTHNASRPTTDHIHFAGFDGPLEITGAESPRRALTALHTYLAPRVAPDLLPAASRLDDLLGPDTLWTNPAAMLNPKESHGLSPEAKELRLLTDDLTTLLATQVPAPGPRETWTRAHLHARTATGLLRYHAAMATPSEDRMAQLLALRARMMADNLLALTEHTPTLAHAHNAHLQRPRSTLHMAGRHHAWWSAGALVETHLNQDYAFLATALGTIPHRGVTTPSPTTLEGLLYDFPDTPYLIDAPRLSKALHDRPPTLRVSPYYGYAPLDPSHVASLDGIVFLRDIPQTQPGKGGTGRSQGGR
ncbi:erythromycin esterase family protein [Streptomyces griseoruber]|uniref:erythromycin esterase family protein n=1 Tax=Streptomyces griseoruber TaxID=1943 RepID=UPI0037B11A8A